MINPPKTKKEARKEIYGKWAGNPKGHQYEEGYCAYSVWSGPRNMMESQCARKNGHGPDKLYCKQHMKILSEI